MRRSGPPRVAEWLLGLLLPARDRSVILGDLAEEHARRSAAGRRRADLWYRVHVARSLPGAVRLRRAAWRARNTKRDRESTMGMLLQDLRYALRSLRKTWAVTAVLAGTLALGIGANTVVFSVVDGTVLNPFPYPEPDRLVGVGTIYPRLGGDLQFWENLSPPEYVDLKEQSRTLEDVVMWDMGFRGVTVGETTQNLFSAFWFDDALPTLGVQPHLGRGFLAEELERGDQVAILSYRAWRTHFNADSSLVGVLPEGTLIYGTDLWLPMGASPAVFGRTRRQMQVLARIAPGATMQQVETELETIARRTEQEYGAEHAEYEGWRLVPMTWTDINVRNFKTAALVLLGAVGFVLLLVCANVGSLQLARASGRRREVAVRTALGASRGRVIRQLLTESVGLAVVGGVVGVAVAFLGIRAVQGLVSAGLVPLPGQVALDGRALAFTGLISVGAGVLFGLVPALHVSRQDLRGVLNAEGQGSTTSAGRLRLQRAFVVVEVALALVLLMGGGLLVNSFLRMQAVDPGFNEENVLAMRLTLARERYTAEEVQPFFRELVRRAETVPGVSSAAVASQIPPRVFSRQRFYIEGNEPVEDAQLPSAYATLASPGYLETLDVELLRGRTLTEQDDAGSPFVAVINEAMARRHFGGDDPLGRRLKVGGADVGSPWFEVVGVVRSMHNRGLDAEPQPEVFASTRQLEGAWNQLFMVVRTEADPYGVYPAIREQVRAMDPDQPVYAVHTLEEGYAEAARERRIATAALSIFAAFALLLAGVGIYAVVAYGVTRRTREIGVRIALGAGKGAVRFLVVRQALVPVAIGGAIGLVGALAMGRVLSGLLFEVSPSDPLTVAAVLATFGAIGIAASYLPAHRASTLDPVEALSSEGR